MTMPERDNAAVAEAWNRNADFWSQYIRKGGDAFRDYFTFPAFARFLPALNGLDVVDFGCGEGANTRRIARMGARVTGIDLSERMLAHAWEAERAEPLGIRYVQGSYAAHTGLPSGSFDGVVSTMALMDGTGLEGAMGEAWRLLRPGGFLAFGVLHPCFMSRKPRWLKNRQGQTTALCISRYFDRTPYTEHWAMVPQPGQAQPADRVMDPLVIERFPRTMADYVNAVAGAGFRIERIDEPMPDDQACRLLPQLALWRDHAAFLLLVMARRPAA